MPYLLVQVATDFNFDQNDKQLPFGCISLWFDVRATGRHNKLFRPFDELYHDNIK